MCVVCDELSDERVEEAPRDCCCMQRAGVALGGGPEGEPAVCVAYIPELGARAGRRMGGRRDAPWSCREVG